MSEQGEGEPPRRAVVKQVAPVAAQVGAVEEVARQTAGNNSSMFQDIKRGARTEIDAICGEISRIGESCGVPTPVNRTMWQLVSALHAG